MSDVGADVLSEVPPRLAALPKLSWDTSDFAYRAADADGISCASLVCVLVKLVEISKFIYMSIYCTAAT